MKIAICERKGSFSDHWIGYCRKSGIPYKVVNPYDSDIVTQTQDCDAFMWHFHHNNYKDCLFAKQLLFSMEKSGKVVYPDTNTFMLFDDKLGEKYLFEAMDVLAVPTYVFYTKQEAINWIEKTTFPKVFKLRNGAGSANVRLVRSASDALKIVRKAFDKGYPHHLVWSDFIKELLLFTKGESHILNVFRCASRIIRLTEDARMRAPEKGYVLFQDFIPNNATDYRVKIVNGNCWAFQRAVRDNDFRASGSGKLIYDNSLIPIGLIAQSQQLARNLGLQTVAFDYLLDKVNNKFLLVEMSYGFGFEDGQYSNGYWDSDLRFHPEFFNPFDWMVDQVVNEVSVKIDV